MTLNYTINEVKPNIFAVEVTNPYHLGMLFCRVQEYYESPNPDFQGKPFSIWDFMEWYASQNKGSFTYPMDWAGFNIPFSYLSSCVQDHFMFPDDIMILTADCFETPYDSVLFEIYKSLKQIKISRPNNEMYVIGTQYTTGDTFQHEVCHGMFYINSEYKQEASDFVNNIDPQYLNIFKRNLMNMGYAEEVCVDEIHAYLMFGSDNPKFNSQIPILVLQGLQKTIHSKLMKYLN